MELDKGGVISGGMTYASMKPMGTRLRETLYESVNNYSEVDFNKDFENIKNEMPDIIDVDFSNVEESDTNFILFIIQKPIVKK
jgi:hypothetical protein